MKKFSMFYLFSIGLLIFAGFNTQVYGSEVIGTYNNGCIRDTMRLDENGQGYQVQKWGPGRNYGHPELIAYIHDLVAETHEQGLPDLLIGDLSKQYGGPFGGNSAHGSHQIGLDVDISFDFASPRKTKSQLEKPADVYLVNTKQEITKNFNADRVQLIFLAAQDERVERIFVAPGIKRHLCELYKDEDRSWLSKVRPWFGHRGHMHVRIGCPQGNSKCIVQAPVPPGDGCGAELQSWFTPPDPHAPPPAPAPKKVLPEECKLVLAGK